MKAVVLLSGGMDSTVTAYVARRDIGKGELFTLSFTYGQRHSRELDCALGTAERLKAAENRLMDVPLSKLVTSSLVVDEAGEPKGELPVEEGKGIPSTWVPQRNSIFLAFAFAYAETVGADRVYIGVNSRDYSGYPDCRPEFIYEMNRALNLASKKYIETGRGIGIIAPLQMLSKTDIIRLGIELGVDFSKTWSCYKGSDLACGLCPSCKIRREAFSSLHLTDPIRYEV